MASLQRDDIMDVLNSIKHTSLLPNAYGVIGGSFRFAKEHNVILINPTKSAIKLKKQTIQKERINLINAGTLDTKPKIKPLLSTNQISFLLHTSKKEEQTIFMPLLLAVTAGLRISEIVAVKYEELRSNFSNFRDLGYICCREDGTPYRRNFVGKPFKRLLRLCEFEDMQWRFLRNTYATILAEYEISMKAIAASLGHHSPDFTKKIYVESPKLVYDLDKEITDFALQLLPEHKNALTIQIEERYLLDVLP